MVPHLFFSFSVCVSHSSMYAGSLLVHPLDMTDSLQPLEISSFLSRTMSHSCAAAYTEEQGPQEGTGPCSWGASLLCAPLGQLRSKVVYFLQNSVSYFLIEHWWAEKGEILAVTRQPCGRRGGGREYPGAGEEVNPSHLRQLLVIWVLFSEYRFHSYST